MCHLQLGILVDSPTFLLHETVSLTDLDFFSEQCGLSRCKSILVQPKAQGQARIALRHEQKCGWHNRPKQKLRLEVGVSGLLGTWSAWVTVQFRD